MSGDKFNPILRGRENPNSRKDAILAMCAACMGCTDTHLEPNWRNEIKNCSSVSCPLYVLRPYKN